jgi:hypothetical protein
MQRGTWRATLSFGLISLWLVLLLSGHAARGAVHLLLLAAIVLFPWRWLRADAPSSPRHDVDHSGGR